MHTKLAFLCTLARDPKGASGDMVGVLDQSVSASLPARGINNVILTIDGHPFRAVLLPTNDNTHYFVFDQCMLSVIPKSLGATIAVEIKVLPETSELDETHEAEAVREPMLDSKAYLVP